MSFFPLSEGVRRENKLYSLRYGEKRANLWVEHVGDALHGSVQHQASHQEDEEHHVGEDGREVHDLENRQTDRTRVRWNVPEPLEASVVAMHARDHH